jgi:NAD(P)-binding Rossmann-like domain
MSLRRRELLTGIAATAAGSLLEREANASPGVIKRDVVIVGGGSAGTYAALRLRDMGKSVAIVEPSGRLGGHAETYYDPSTGLPIDIGVIVFPDNELVRNYFNRFSQPLMSANFAGGVEQAVDFRTGSPVEAYTPAPADLGAALGQYAYLLATRYAFLEQPGFQLPTHGPILDELVAPFGQFVQSNGLQALVPLFAQYEQGFGPLLDATTLYVLKNLGQSVVGGIANGSFVLAPYGTSALYGAATAELAEDVLFGASVDSVRREGRSKITVRARTASGSYQIRAKRLLFTAPPLLQNFTGFDLDCKELPVILRFQAHAYWTGVLAIDGLPPGVSLVNRAADALYNLGPVPGVYSVGPSAVPGLYNVKYGSTSVLSDAAVKDQIVADLGRVVLPGGGRPVVNGFAIFKSHSPYSLVASPQAIRRGFYRDLQALQGHNDTYYAGAALETHSSAAIWAFLEAQLPTMFA